MALDPEIILQAYTQGIFPMADLDGKIRWYKANPRGVLPLEGFHIPKSLGQFMRSAGYPYEVRVNTDFRGAMAGCMKQRLGETWITDELIEAYVKLHQMGFAHSVETWEDGVMVGGLYGVALGAAFFGESMFHTRRDASKVALVELVGRLKSKNFVLLDTQTTTEHLKKFGCIEIPERDYLRRLRQAIVQERSFL